MTADLNMLVLLAAAPFVLRADEPATSVLWLVWLAHTAWLLCRDLAKAGSR